MKLQTQFTVPHKILRDIDHVKKMEVLEETFKKECIDYPTQEDCLVYCNWVFIIDFLLLKDINNMHKFLTLEVKLWN